MFLNTPVDDKFTGSLGNQPYVCQQDSAAVPSKFLYQPCGSYDTRIIIIFISLNCQLHRQSLLPVESLPFINGDFLTPHGPLTRQLASSSTWSQPFGMHDDPKTKIWFVGGRSSPGKMGRYWVWCLIPVLLV